MSRVVYNVISLIAALTVAAVSGGEMNNTFCDLHKGTPSTQTVVAPKLTMDHISSYEMTTEGMNWIGDLTMYYSTTRQVMMRKFKKFGESDIMYVHAKTDTYMQTTSDRPNSCYATPLDTSVIGTEYNIKRDPTTGKIVIPPLQYMMAADQYSAPVYMGEDIVRGIPARKWHLCLFTNGGGYDETISADLYYSQENYAMPGSSKPVPLMIDFYTQSASFNVHRRYDYGMFTDRIDPMSKAYEIPTSMYCKDRSNVSIDHLPSPPEDFQFEAIEATFFSPSLLTTSKPILKYRKETFATFFKMFVRDQHLAAEQTSSNEVKKRMVHDYISGLQYDISLTTGSCKVGPISVNNPDVSRFGFDMVKMKTPREFFKLDIGTYQYMGRHTDMDRDIESDVYTVVNKNGRKSTTSTWWFASKTFLRAMGYVGTSWVVPLRYREVTDMPASTKEIDFYKFSEEPTRKDTFPDLSPCFAVGKELYLEIVLTGMYDMVYVENPKFFKADFGTAMILYAGIISPARIARLTVRPAGKESISVQFTLLDKPGQFGNAISGIDEPGNDVVWKKLRANLDSGKFVVTVHNDFGTHKLTVINYSQDFKDPNSFAGRVAFSSSQASDGYTPGAMGGLGFGMLLLGLVIGFGGMKGAKRYRDRVPDISMHSLGGT